MAGAFDGDNDDEDAELDEEGYYFEGEGEVELQRVGGKRRDVADGEKKNKAKESPGVALGVEEIDFSGAGVGVGGGVGGEREGTTTKRSQASLDFEREFQELERQQVFEE